MSDFTEKEKMLAGQIYLATDAELVEDHKRAVALCREYNATDLEEEDILYDLMKRLFGAVGTGAEISAPFFCAYGYNIFLGNNVYFNYGGIIIDCGKVTIGDDTLIGTNVQFLAANHPIDPVERLKKLEYTKDITIGKNVWIGGGVIIVSGVTIGDNAVIGAGSVVTKDIPGDVIAAGNPCRVIRPV